MNSRDLAMTPRSKWLRRWIGPIAGLLAGLVVSRWRNRSPRDRAAALRATAADNDPAAHTRPASDRDLPEPDASADTQAAPDPEDPSSPESPTDLKKRSVLFVMRKTAREFSTDQCTDLAAALTYYAVLSLFPALVVVVSLLGVFGQGQRTTEAVLEIVGDLGPASAVDTLRAPIQQLVESPSAGFALIVGIAGALWSAAGYIGAFGRAMNRMYEVEEGRPVWKLRPIQLLLTLVGLIAVAVVAFMLAGQRTARPGNRRRPRGRRGHADGLEHRALADRPDLRDCGGRRPVLLLAQRQATQVPLDQHRGRAGDPGLDPGIHRVRLLCRQLR